MSKNKTYEAMIKRIIRIAEILAKANIRNEIDVDGDDSTPTASDKRSQSDTQHTKS